MVGDVEGSHESRPRREDHPSDEHGLQFSEWKVLVGPSDWKDHSSGKEGAERYRSQNLPLPAEGSKAGVYEIGIAAVPTADGRVIRKLGKDCIIPVYIGASDNVRTRLQGYGRDGGHLEHGSSPAPDPCRSGPGLFTEMLEKGYAILYRWVPMKSKEEAKQKEAKLLDKYDYAWNKRGNGPSRREDVPKKLEKMDFCTARSRKGKEQASAKKQFPECCIARKSPPRKVEHPDDLVFHRQLPPLSIVPYRPRLVQAPTVSFLNIRAAKEEGCTRRNIPVHCETKLRPEHEVVRSGLLTGKEFPEAIIRNKILDFILEDAAHCVGFQVADVGFLEVKEPVRLRLRSTPEVEDKQETRRCLVPTVTLSDDDHICGVVKRDGSLCRNRPHGGRRRCDEHKGQRVTVSGPEESKASWRVGGQSPVCGVPLAGGSICRQIPYGGRKRCDDHKGRRITETSSSVWASGSFSMASSCCGATMRNGAPCMAAPLPGRKRCGRHKGMRI